MYSSLSADILHLGIQPVMKGRQGRERERERQIINKGASRRVDGETSMHAGKPGDIL